MRWAGQVRILDKGTTKDRPEDSNREGGKGQRGAEMRGLGRDGHRRWTLLQ